MVMSEKWTSSFRVSVFVPDDALDNFISNVQKHIPSFLGNYDYVCWWSENGIEQSRFNDGVTVGGIKRVKSMRFEFSMPADREMLNKIIDEVIIPNHPWEEPVILVNKAEIFNHGKN